MQTFNVSIPRHHIETEIWEFQYGPAENDPEHGPFAVEKEEDVNGDAMLIDATRSDGDEETVVGGEWSHHLTGEKLGGTEGILHFTVIGQVIQLWVKVSALFTIVYREDSKSRIKCSR